MFVTSEIIGAFSFTFHQIHRSTLTHWMKNVCGISPCWVPAVENCLVSFQQTIRILMSGAQHDHQMQLAFACGHRMFVPCSYQYQPPQARNDDTLRVPTGSDKNVWCIFSLARLLNVTTCSAVRLRCKVRDCMCTCKRVAFTIRYFQGEMMESPTIQVGPDSKRKLDKDYIFFLFILTTWMLYLICGCIDYYFSDHRNSEGVLC